MTTTVTATAARPWLRAVRRMVRVGLLSSGPAILAAGRARLSGATTRIATTSLTRPLACRVALPLSLSLPFSGACLTTLTVAIGAVNSTSRVGGGTLATHDALLSRLALATAWLTLATGLGVGSVAGSRAATSAPAGVSG